MKEENIPRSKAKLAILIVTYGGNSGCEGEIISNLSKDPLLLRESLWGLLYNEENSLCLFFSQKHQLSFKPPYKKGLSHYKLGKLKSSFQAIYCQNEETKCLRLLRETFLKESGFSPEPAFTQRNLSCLLYRSTMELTSVCLISEGVLLPSEETLRSCYQVVWTTLTR